MPEEETHLLTRVTMDLRDLFGQLVEPHDGEGPVQVSFPGHDYVVCLWPIDHERALFRIVVPVTAHADWTTSGLPDFLIREAGRFIFGRLERCGDGITLEHALFAATPAEDLGYVIRALVHTAVRLERDLCRMGALSEPDEDADA